jgi:putative glutamine amidotransferase
MDPQGNRSPQGEPGYSRSDRTAEIANAVLAVQRQHCIVHLLYKVFIINDIHGSAGSRNVPERLNVVNLPLFTVRCFLFTVLRVKPRIAIPVPTSTDTPYNQRSWPSYAEAVSRSGGDPIQIDLSATPTEIQAIADTCAGVCLPGSPADVDPLRYTADPHPATSAADPAREAADNLLLEDAYKHHKPVLGICYGIQSLNVFRGGTLVQDLTPLPVNHSAGRAVAVAHTTLVAENSLLASLLDPADTSHHQSVASPGDGLRIVARCPDDGVVEAIEADPAEPGTPHFVLAVQWHPERSYDISPASRALFDRLVQEAASR